MKEQRKLEILKFLNKKGFSTIAELAEQFEVSQSTIRRDLAELERSDLAAFKRDGIVPLSQDRTDSTVHYRAAINARAKAMLARAAIKLISEGSTVFLDSSSTVLTMTPALRSFRSLNVITNSLITAKQLRGCSFPVYVIGGEISPRSKASFGPVAEEMLRDFNFDYAFFSPVAITPSNYVAETTMNAAAVRRAALEQSSTSVLLCDHSKIGLTRAFNVAHLDEFDYLITDDTHHAFDTSATVRRIKE